MTEAILTLKHKDGRKAKIYQDDCPESPRSWDNLGTIKTWTRNSDFSDKHAPHITSEEWEEWSKDHEIAFSAGLDILNYGSSGIKIALNNALPEDSDGVVFVTKKDALENFPQKTLNGNVTDESFQRIRDTIKGEIETLQQWASGDVYGFQIFKPETCKHCKHTEEVNEDSCWGFYGLDSIKEELTSQGFKEGN